MKYGVARELAQRVLDRAEPAKAMPMVAGAHYILGIIPSFSAIPRQRASSLKSLSRCSAPDLSATSVRLNAHS